MRQAISIDGHDLDAAEVVAVSKVYTKTPKEIFKETKWEVYFTIYFKAGGGMQVHRSEIDDTDVASKENIVSALRKELMDKL